MARIFISHTSAHRQEAEEIQSWLKSNHHELFFDSDRGDGIKAGELWEPALVTALQWADVLVCVVTPGYAESDWCTLEVGAARGRGLRILPIQMVESTRPRILASTQFIDAVVDREAGCNDLLERLRVIDGLGLRAWSPNTNPYPGMRPFRVDEADIFFGRRIEINQILQLLRSTDRQNKRQLFAIAGQSGCGKSSIARAGILPRISDEPEWLHLGNTVLPGLDPIFNLSRELSAFISKYSSGVRPDTVRDRLVSDLGIKEVIDVLKSIMRDQRATRLLVVIDQFEEILSVGMDLRSKFSTILQHFLDNSIDILVTVKTEFLGTLMSDSEMKELGIDDYLLKPLSRDGIQTIITEPARIARITIDRDLVNRLSEETFDGDVLPLLALTLHDLAENVSQGGAISLKDYAMKAGIHEALKERADGAIAAVSRERALTREEVTRALVEFVDIDENRQPIRRRVHKRSVVETSDWPLIDTFIANGLIVTDGVRDQFGRYSEENATLILCHDALLTAWPAMVNEISERRSALRIRRHIEQEAKEWSERDGKLWKNLWDGDRLATARDLLGTRTRLRWPTCAVSKRDSASRKDYELWRLVEVRTDIRLEEVGTAFLAQSLLKQKIKSGRTKAVVITTVVALALLSIWGYDSAQNATAQSRKSDAIRLIAEGQSQINNSKFGSEEDGIKKIIGASLLNWESSDGALFDAVTGLRQLHRIFTSGVAASSVVFSRDGHRAATAMNEGTGISVWNLDTGKSVGPPLDTLSPTIYALALTSNGDRLAYSDETGAVTVWDVAEGKSITVIKSNSHNVNILAFSPDDKQIFVGRDGIPAITVHKLDSGEPTEFSIVDHEKAFTCLAFDPVAEQIALGDSDGTVTFWDAHSLTPIAHSTILTHQGAISSLAYSPDGTRLVSTGRIEPLRLWSTLTHTLINDDAVLGPIGPLSDAAFSVRGDELISAGTDGFLRRWDGVTGRRIVGPAQVRSGDKILAVAFLPNDDSDQKRVIAGYMDGSIRTWNLNQNGDSGGAVTQASDVEITSTAVSPDGTQAAYGDREGRISILATDTPVSPETTIISGSKPVKSLAFSGVNSLVSGGADGKVQVWNLERYERDGAPLTNDQADLAEIVSVAISQDGRFVAASDTDGNLKIWDRVENQTPLVRNFGLINSLAFSSGGSFLIAGGEHGFLQVLESKKLTRKGNTPVLPEGSTVLSVAISQQSTVAAVGLDSDENSYGQSTTVMLWSLGNDPVGIPITGHKGAISAVSFSKDGEYLASVSRGGETQIYDLAGQTVGQPLDGVKPLKDLVFGYRDEAIITVDKDGGVSAILGPALWQKDLCEKFFGGISDEDWRSWDLKKPGNEKCR